MTVVLAGVEPSRRDEVSLASGARQNAWLRCRSRVGLALRPCPTRTPGPAPVRAKQRPGGADQSAIFVGNKFVDDHALQPVARGYEDYVPGRAEKHP